MVGGEGIAASTDRDVIAYGRVTLCTPVIDATCCTVPTFVSVNHYVTRGSRNYVFLR